MTGNQLVQSALRLIHALEPGETPDAAEAQDALFVANQLLAAWSAEELMGFTETISEFPLIPLQQVYTIGPGGDFNVARPIRIDRISIVSLNNPAQPLELPIEMLSDRDWQALPVKSVTGSLPMYVYDDGGFPLRSLGYWTIPTVPVNTIIYGWTALAQFPNLVSNITFPPGYEKALRYNLAVDLAPEWNLPCPPEVMAQAITLKGALKSLNIDTIQTTPDPATLSPEDGIYDWRSDSFVK